MKSLSVVIPTYNRGAVLLDTVRMLLGQSQRASEIIVVDQTVYEKGDDVAQELDRLDKRSDIVWLRLELPSIPHAMNAGLLKSSSDYVLFLDDDVRFSSEFLMEHCHAIEKYNRPAHVGRIIQPWQKVVDASTRLVSNGLKADLEFAFNSNELAEIQNCMAGNLCVDRALAIQAGGFDEQFYGAAFRFETEFCRRFIRLTNMPFLFFPSASLDHLKVDKGGTRQYVDNFLVSSSSVHSIGDYYFALREAKGFERAKYIFKRLLSCVVARFYLRKPWWIPVRFIGECRGLLQAISKYRSGPKYIAKV